MQKLVWQNSNGDVIDLTSGYYGITNWEGFSNTSLNIQSQQVPFQDGGVFLDALIDQRELSVTLAMDDGGNLETRYRLRRELIHALNPKLGEGYLIYTNDFISKRIKCVAQIPLFETHNSNDSGTPKASLAWTACNPYWEDLEENFIFLKAGERKIIENSGDVGCSVIINEYTKNAVNPQIQNISENKKIEILGNYNNNIVINTNNGEKGVVKAEASFDNKNSGSPLLCVRYIESLGYFIAVGEQIILKSEDGRNWKYIKGGGQSITYSENLQLFIATGVGVGRSSDGENWEWEYMQKTYYSAIYCESLGMFIVVGEGIITSPDGITWTERNIDIYSSFKSVVYSEELGLLVAVGETTGSGLIATSTDGITWTLQTNIDVRLYEIVYADKFNLFVAVGGANVFTSPDGITWTEKDFPELYIDSLYTILYADALEMLVIFSYDGLILTSIDGLNWIAEERNEIEYVQSSTYSKDKGLFVAVGLYGVIAQSLNGKHWNRIGGVYENRDLTGIAYSNKEKLYVAVSQYGTIITSKDLKCWERQVEGIVTNGLLDIIYVNSQNKFVACGVSGYISQSTDGKQWISSIVGSIDITDIIFIESKNKYYAISQRNILISSDAITWESYAIGNTGNFTNIAYSDKLNLFVAIGYTGLIATSADGITWELQNTNNFPYLLNITYSDNLELFVAVGNNNNTPFVITSADGIGWNYIDLSSITASSIYDIDYSNTLGIFIAVGDNGCIITSTNANDWEVIDVDIPQRFLNVVSFDEEATFVITGENGYILKYEIDEITNIISSLSNDSDLTLNLGVGENELLLNCQSGTLSCSIQFRQKYIGV